jgi:hypothetical protein
MTHLEAGQRQLITEARAAAGMAATGLAGSVISDVVTRPAPSLVNAQSLKINRTWK